MLVEGERKEGKETVNVLFKPSHVKFIGENTRRESIPYSRCSTEDLSNVLWNIKMFCILCGPCSVVRVPCDPCSVYTGFPVRKYTAFFFIVFEID